MQKPEEACRSPDIYVYPHDLWKYIQNYKGLLASKIIVIAEDLQHEVEVTLELNADDLVLIRVWKEGKEIESDCILNADDAEYTSEDIYERYFMDCDEEDGEIESDDDDDDAYIAQEIADREDELYAGLETFLIAVFGDDYYKLDNNSIEELMDSSLQTIADLGYSVYRPTIFEDENGEEIIEEYPYNAEESDDNTETTPDNRVEI